MECVTWFPDGDAIATGSKDSICRIYDLRCCGQLGTYVGSTIRTSCNTVEFSRSGRFLFAGYADSKIRVFDLTKSSQMGPFATLGGHRRSVTAIRRAPQGDAMISAGLDSKVLLYA